MPQRSLIVEATRPLPTPLRRSQRLLQLTSTAGTRNPTSKGIQVHPISHFSATSSTPRSSSRSSFNKKPESGFSENFSKNPSESNVGSRNLDKSARGRRALRFSSSIKSNVSDCPRSVSRSEGRGDCPGKSSNGSMNSGKSVIESSGLNSNYEGFEGLRRSSRLCRKVNSLIGSLQQVVPVAIDNSEMHSLEPSPITPLGMGEKKSRFSDTFKHSMSKSQKRIVGYSVSGEERGTTQFKLKEGRIDSARIIVCGLACRSVSLSLRATPGGQRGRQHKAKANHEKDIRAGHSCEPIDCERMVTRSASKRMQKQDDSCRQLLERRSSCTSVSLSLCGSPGGRQGRQRKAKANHEKNIRAGHSPELIVRDSERIVARSASKCMQKQDDSCRQLLKRRSSCTSSRNVPRKAAFMMTMKEKQEGSDSLKNPIGQSQKRVTRSSVASFSMRLNEELGSQGIVGHEKEHNDCNKQVNCELKQECSDVLPLCDDPRGGKSKNQALNKDTKLNGNKRKRNQAGLQGTDEGWTKEQEIALQRAYFAAKPSPHFWKKVAKLVLGKSAQECFDKVHSDNLTPLSTRRSSRAKKWNSPSDLSLSGCKLFKSAEKKSKKIKRTKQKSHVARKTIRHLLQKHCMVNQDNETDMFSILEPTVNPSVEVLQLNAAQSTPNNLLGSPGSSSKGCDKSSGHKKRLSRFSSASKSPLTSPPVLKKVKNMALHEKYIDQLHKREANRKVQSKRYVKLVPGQQDAGEPPVAMKDVIRAAKDALVSDAREAINKFRNSQASIMDAFSDSEEAVLTNEDEDDVVMP